MTTLARDPFAFFEIHKVAEYGAGTSEGFCETIDTPSAQEAADEEASSQFWTVYGWRPYPEDDIWVDGAGTTAIADLTTYEAALDLAIALAGGDEDRVVDHG